MNNPNPTMESLVARTMEDKVYTFEQAVQAARADNSLAFTSKHFPFGANFKCLDGRFLYWFQFFGATAMLVDAELLNKLKRVNSFQVLKIYDPHKDNKIPVDMPQLAQARAWFQNEVLAKEPDKTTPSENWF